MESDELKAAKKALLHYCNYRERTTKEVREYLKKFPLKSLEAEILLCELIENDVVNDYRFAKMYVSGKFRINGWGKDKIAYYLRSFGISDSIIAIALEEIDDEEYRSLAKKFVEKKQKDLGKKDLSKDVYKKIFNYLKAKGFEKELISSLMKYSE